MKKIRIIKITTIIAITLLLVTNTILLVLNKRTVYIPRNPYNKEGFVDVKKYDEEEIVLENNSFRFTLDTNTTTFNVLDKESSQVWQSIAETTLMPLPQAVKELFVVYYETKLEGPKPYELNKYSILENRYQFRLNDDGSLEVLYLVGGKLKNLFEDLPRRIEKERFEELVLEPLRIKVEDKEISNRELLLFQQQYSLIQEEGGFYFLKNLQSQDAIDLVFNLLYEHSLYTQEDYIQDNSQYGYDVIRKIPYFEFSVKYKLTNKGLQVSIINDSIYETEDFMIAYIDVLPFFGVNNIGDQGVTIIPDGSGILINHDNNKYQTVEYSKRIYGKDLAIGNAHEVMPTSEEKIIFPMYAYVKNNNSFINIIESGAAMTTMKAGFKTTGNADSYEHIIPYAHYRWSLRERDSYKFQSTNNTQNIYTWTKEYTKEDYVSEYIFLNQNSYFEIAKAYQAYIVEKYALHYIENQPKVHLTILGGYQDKQNFFGIPYETTKTLTNTNEILTIVDEIIHKGVDNLSVNYQGWSNNGINPEANNKVRLNGSIGTNNDFKNLINELKERDVSLFLELMVNTSYTKDNISVKNDTLQTLMQKSVYRQKYDESMDVVNPAMNHKKGYKLSINKKESLIESYNKYLNKLNLNTFGTSDLTNEVGSNFKIGSVLLKDQVVEKERQMIENIDKQTSFRNPNFYGLIYADQVLDIPVEGTKHKMVDYDIPFVQLVLNGYFNYAGPSINMYQSKSVLWHMLFSMSTGSQIQFTLSHDQTIKLVNTPYGHYFQTYYKNWTDEISNMYQILSNLNIYNARIIDHRVLNQSGSVVRVTYDTNVVLTIDYDNLSYSISEVTP